MDCINQILGDMEFHQGGYIGGHNLGSRYELLEDFTDENLRSILTRCIEQEEYEKACIYRDELSRRESLKEKKHDSGE